MAEISVNSSSRQLSVRHRGRIAQIGIFFGKFDLLFRQWKTFDTSGFSSEIAYSHVLKCFITIVLCRFFRSKVRLRGLIDFCRSRFCFSRFLLDCSTLWSATVRGGRRNHTSQHLAYSRMRSRDHMN